MDTAQIWNIVSLVLLLAGLAGTVLPILPGTLLSLAGLLIFQYLGSGGISVWVIISLGIFAGASILLSYTLPLKQSTKYGGSTFGKWGGILGAILFFLIPVLPFGLLFGMFIGIFIGEFLYYKQDFGKAVQALKGAAIGFLLSSLVNLCLAILMIIVVLFKLTF